jgi:ribosomal protein S18 acetylase RimI-like enzyme
MNNSLRMMRDNDAEQLSLLIRRTFRQYIAHTYTKRGIRVFEKNTSAKALLRRKRKNQLIIVAETEDTISGVIAVRKGNHISLLFVAPEFHGKAIGSLLCREAISRIKTATPDIRCATVNSSEYALPFYAKLGFTVKRPAFFHKGMKMTAMELRL